MMSMFDFTNEIFNIENIPEFSMHFSSVAPLKTENERKFKQREWTNTKQKHRLIALQFDTLYKE